MEREEGVAGEEVAAEAAECDPLADPVSLRLRGEAAACAVDLRLLLADPLADRLADPLAPLPRPVFWLGVCSLSPPTASMPSKLPRGGTCSGEGLWEGREEEEDEAGTGAAAAGSAAAAAAAEEGTTGANGAAGTFLVFCFLAETAATLAACTGVGSAVFSSRGAGTAGGFLRLLACARAV